MPNVQLLVHLDLENPTADVQTIFLEKGRCFEVINPDSGLQNVTLAENTEIVIPPNSEISVDLPGYCLNKHRKMTLRRHDANVTPFLLEDPCNDQESVWAKMALPAA